MVKVPSLHCGMATTDRTLRCTSGVATCMSHVTGKHAVAVQHGSVRYQPRGDAVPIPYMDIQRESTMVRKHPGTGLAVAEVVTCWLLPELMQCHVI